MAGGCYVLEVSLGAPFPAQAEFYAYNALEHVRACLEQLLGSATGQKPRFDVDDANLGTALLLWALRPGREAEMLELRPFLRASVPGGEAVALDTPAFLQLESELRAKRLSAGDVTLAVDWAGIEAAAPPLKGKRLRPGETLALEQVELGELGEAGQDSALAMIEELPYGYSDHEGSQRPPAGFVDPDPPRTSNGNRS
jgi:hypothetical protein